MSHVLCPSICFPAANEGAILWFLCGFDLFSISMNCLPPIGSQNTTPATLNLNSISKSPCWQCLQVWHRRLISWNPCQGANKYAPGSPPKVTGVAWTFLGLGAMKFGKTSFLKYKSNACCKTSTDTTHSCLFKCWKFSTLRWQHWGRPGRPLAQRSSCQAASCASCQHFQQAPTHLRQKEWTQCSRPERGQ